MTTQETHLSQPQIDELERLYSLRNKDRVFAYLERHPALIPFLLTEAPHKIAHYFPSSPLVLSWEKNWDAVNDDDHFFYIEIMTDIEDTPTILAAEERLHREWYYLAPHDIFMHLRIAAEPREETA